MVLETPRLFERRAPRGCRHHTGVCQTTAARALFADLARAETRLAELARACAGPCEEQTDLKRAIDRFKANGNKFVAEAR